MNLPKVTRQDVLALAREIDEGDLTFTITLAQRLDVEQTPLFGYLANYFALTENKPLAAMDVIQVAVYVYRILEIAAERNTQREE